MNSTTLNSDESFTPHILCVSHSTDMRVKMIETMNLDYVITLCPAEKMPSRILSQSFDLGIVCAEAPKTDCDAVLKKMLERDRVILVGDHFDPWDVAHAFDLGIIDYFPEPIDYNLLWQRIGYLIK
jgi:DNA-binding response OmpR family regulator